MSVDCRTRRHCDRKSLTRDEIFDSLIPKALRHNAELAGRGLRYMFTEEEMASVSADLAAPLSRVRPDDGAYCAAWCFSAIFCLSWAFISDFFCS